MRGIFIKHKYLIIITAFILLRLLYTYYIGIIKPTVIESFLEGKEYIVCREVLVSGAEWVMIQDENGNDVYKYIDLRGLENLENLPRYIDTNNKYVFYFNNKFISDDYFGEPILTYNVTDWDIIFPIKRGDRISGIFESGGFVTLNDITVNNKKILFAVIGPIVLIIVFRIIYTMIIGIVKCAVRKNKIFGRYILCKYCFRKIDSWLMIQDENGEKTFRYVHLINLDDFEPLPKNIGYKNTYVFYIEDKPVKNIEEGYKIINWDIIYPVRRDNRFFGWLELRSVITRNDM